MRARTRGRRSKTRSTTSDLRREPVVASRPMAKPLEYNATLTERIDITDALSIFRVTPDKMPEQHPWFTPGQYCVLGLNNAAKPELGSVRRSMSIASAPEDK